MTNRRNPSPVSAGTLNGPTTAACCRGTSPTASNASRMPAVSPGPDSPTPSASTTSRSTSGARASSRQEEPCTASSGSRPGYTKASGSSWTSPFQLSFFKE